MARGNHIGAGASVLAACLASCQGPGSTKTTDVPLAWVPVLLPLADGGSAPIGLRLETAISIQGSAPVAATLDTGSAGVQLLARLLPASTLAALPSTGAVIEATFPESGIQAQGYVANATIGFSAGVDAGTPGPTTTQILVAVFDQLTCLPGNPCQNADGGLLETLLFDGVPALLGLGMRNSNIGGFGNPIVQLPGKPPFILEAPASGSDGGILRIAPPSTEVATYATAQLPASDSAPLPNGAPPWNDMGVPACVNEPSANLQFCGNALLDTGTPWIEINWTGQRGVTEVAPGTEVSVAIGSFTAPLVSYQITVGAPPRLGADEFVLAPPVTDAGNLIILGLPVFARYDVLFDQANGRVGLRDPGDSMIARLHLIDGTYELFRAHFSQRPAYQVAGQDLKATLGLTSSMIALLHEPAEAVTHAAIAFDNPIRSIRNDWYPGYKSDEGVPTELRSQFDVAEEAARALGLAVWSMDRWEADDALATAATRFGSRVEQVRILTPDKDLGQVVRGRRVVLVDRMRQKVIDEEEFFRRKGVRPASVPDWLALVGDAADGFPGLAGFGDKTAAALLGAFPHLEEIPADPRQWPSGIRGAERLARTLNAEREAALLYRKLATLIDDVPLAEDLDDLAWKGVPVEAFAAWCERAKKADLTRQPLRWQG